MNFLMALANDSSVGLSDVRGRTLGTHERRCRPVDGKNF
jgi:hypothetical protein